MNEKIAEHLGFKKEVELVKFGNCPFCGKRVVMLDFRDALSRKEYSISGLCQKCQDEFFR